MRIHYKSLDISVTGEAPFDGVVLHAKERDSRHHSKGVEKLIKEIIASKYEGMIFKGDWTKQALQLIEVLKNAENKHLKIVIYTDYDLEQFKTLVGQACYENTNKVKLNKEQVELNKAMLSLIGGMMIDYYIPEDYHVICGTGEQRQVCLIKKIREDESFFEEEVDNE